MSAPGIAYAQTVAGTLSRVYVDREHVKQAGAAARPWVVENDRGKFRCRAIERLDHAKTAFDLNAKPALWLVTRKSVVMSDVEVLP